MKSLFTFVLFLTSMVICHSQISFEVTGEITADCSGVIPVYNVILISTTSAGTGFNLISCSEMTSCSATINSNNFILISGNITTMDDQIVSNIQYTDSFGTTFTSSISIDLPEIVVVETATFFNSSCEDDDGSVVLTVDADPSDYSIAWFESPNNIGSGLTINGLQSSDYIYALTNEVCLAPIATSFTIDQDPPVEVTIQENNGGCLTPEDMEYEAIATGGSGTFTYSWEAAGATNTYAAATAVADGFVQADIYTVTVTDENNPSCTDTEDVIVIAGDNDCIGDINCDGVINAGDLLKALGYFSLSPSLFDSNYDGTTNAADVLFVMGSFGSICPN
ncbi:MAG: hypothetical protein ACPGED_06175 [Flavobacteriales bacterium]